MTEFINGVEYLYTIPAEEPTSYWILVAIFFIAFALFGIIVYSFWGGFEDIVMALLLAAIATLLSFFGIKSNNANELLPERYAVTISDDADMKEFVGNYTIVEQKGNVFIIEVKGEQK